MPLVVPPHEGWEQHCVWRVVEWVLFSIYKSRSNCLHFMFLHQTAELVQQNNGHFEMRELWLLSWCRALAQCFFFLHFPAADPQCPLGVMLQSSFPGAAQGYLRVFGERTSPTRKKKRLKERAR